MIELKKILKEHRRSKIFYLVIIVFSIALFFAIVFPEHSRENLLSEKMHTNIITMRVSRDLTWIKSILEKHYESKGCYPKYKYMIDQGDRVYYIPQNIINEYSIRINIDEAKVYDKFSEKKNRNYQYYSGEYWYILISCGPDKKYSTELLSIIDAYYLDDDMLIRNDYDPTNGIISGGDLILSSRNISEQYSKDIAERYCNEGK